MTISDPDFGTPPWHWWERLALAVDEWSHPRCSWVVAVFLGGFTSHKKTTDTVTDGFFKVCHSKVVAFFFLGSLKRSKWGISFPRFFSPKCIQMTQWDGVNLPTVFIGETPPKTTSIWKTCWIFEWTWESGASFFAWGDVAHPSQLTVIRWQNNVWKNIAGLKEKPWTKIHWINVMPSNIFDILRHFELSLLLLRRWGLKLTYVESNHPWRCVGNVCPISWLANGACQLLT